MPPTFAANLVHLLTVNAKSKAEVADRVRVSPSTVTRWTDPSEDRELSAQDLLALARVLGVDPYVLMGSTFVEPKPASTRPKRGRPPRLVPATDVERVLERGEKGHVAQPSPVPSAPKKRPRARGERG